MGTPILVDGVLDTGTKSNEFSTDWLFSYRPIPGTLAYFGYGSTMVEPNEFRFSDLERTRDGFFGKLSYLFRFWRLGCDFVSRRMVSSALPV